MTEKMHTFTGKKVNPMKFESDAIDIVDIAPVSYTHLGHLPQAHRVCLYPGNCGRGRPFCQRGHGHHRGLSGQRDRR